MPAQNKLVSQFMARFSLQSQSSRAIARMATEVSFPHLRKGNLFRTPSIFSKQTAFPPLSF